MNTKKLKKALFAWILFFCGMSSFFLSCWRDNPVDAKSGKYIPGSRPHVQFVEHSISAFLFDQVTFKIIWSDTAIGGVKGAIKKYYFNWNNDTIFNDSMDGTSLDTFIFSKTFPPGTFTVRMKAMDFDGEYSDIDSMNLTVFESKPRIDSINAPPMVEKSAMCTVSVSASDSGGTIRSFLWAKDGIDFADTTAVGTFYVSFKDTGDKVLLVKVRDNKAVESAIDTFHIGVYENFYSTFYDGNGAASGTLPTDMNRYAQGQNVMVLGNTGTLVKTGFVFTGWNTMANGGGASYTAGSTFSMDIANVTLFAQWTVNPTYAVAYNGNGSTGGTVPADTAGYTLGQSVLTKGNTGSLVKTGYAFIGWNTQANGSGISYATGVAFTMGSSNVTLFAQWTAKPTYTVTYNGNGNSSGTVPADKNNYTIGAIVTIPGNTGFLAKTGFTFVGWNTQSNGAGASYATGVTFTMGSANVNLFAQWTSNPTYTVTYNGNGGGSGTAPKDNNNYLTGATVTVLGNTGSLVRTGYTFSGWDTVAAGTGTNYAAGSTFIMALKNVTLYAQWTIISTFTVTYNGNGATGGNAPVDNNHYTFGQNVTVMGNIGSLVKSGNAFIGWNTQANGSGISYATGVAFTMGSSNVTLYAQWTINPTYSVTYNGNGNSGGTAPADNNNYVAGAIVTVPGQGTLVKTGFTFIGWNTLSNGNGTNYATGVTFTMGSANVNLFAQWTANPTYTIAYNGNGATSGTAPKDNNNYLTGATAAVLGNTGSLVRTGNTFAGWDTVAAGNGANFAAGTTFKIASANDTLFAQWAIIPTYTVTYNGNGNSNGSVPIDTAHYILGQSVTTRGNTGSLIKTGNTFIGWNTQANGSGIGYATGISFPMGSVSVTLYAQWTANPTYTVTYYGNGNSGGTVPPDNNNYITGTTVTVVGNTGFLAKTGFTFVGWNTQPNGSGTSYATGVTFTMGSVNVNLFAQWTANPTYTVAYYGNGAISGTAPKDNNNYLTGVTVAVLGNTALLARTGYTFTGWDTVISGNGANFAVGATFKMASANDTLFAQWTPTFTVTYNANGGGGAAPNDNNSYLSGATVTVLGAGALTKTNNTFTGWNRAQNGSLKSYAPGDTLIMGSVNVTLFAQWTIIPTFTVTYNANGATGGSVPKDTAHYAQGQNDTIRSNTGSLVIAGFTFIGWNTQANGLGVSYTQGLIIAMGPSNLVLYAQWTAKPTFTIFTSSGANGLISPSGNVTVMSGANQTFMIVPDSNNLIVYHIVNVMVDGTSKGAVGTYAFTNVTASHTISATFAVDTFTITFLANDAGAGGTMTAQNIVSGSTAPLKANAFTKTGWSFAGWANTSTGAVLYADAVSYTMGTSNVTLYAKWTINQYNVAFNSNGGTAVNSQNVTYNTTATQPSPAPTRTGYTFAGWYSDAGLTSVFNFTTPITAPITLYAKWTINTYTITFDRNGGTVDANPTSKTATYGGNVGTLPTAPSRTGYAFASWNTASDGSGTAFTASTPVTATITVYAQWTINTYTVTFDKNGGTTNANPTSKTAMYGGTVGTLPTAPSRMGYAFASWNTASDGSGTAFTVSTPVTATITVYAQWTINSYTVTFDKNGGTIDANPTSKTAAYGGTVGTLPTAPSRTGYAFASWNMASDGSGTAFTVSTPVTATITVYAQWTINTYTVTFDKNGGTTDANPTTKTATYQGNVGSLPTPPSQTGYTFTGWNTANDGNGTAFTASTAVTASIPVYAQWTINQYTVDFNSNGGSAVTSQSVNYNATATQPSDPTKTDSTFAGWYSDEGLLFAFSFSTLITASITLYAQWTTP